MARQKRRELPHLGPLNSGPGTVRKWWQRRLVWMWIRSLRKARDRRLSAWVLNFLWWRWPTLLPWLPVSLKSRHSSNSVWMPCRRIRRVKTWRKRFWSMSTAVRARVRRWAVCLIPCMAFPKIPPRVARRVRWLACLRSRIRCRVVLDTRSLKAKKWGDRVE